MTKVQLGLVIGGSAVGGILVGVGLKVGYDAIRSNPIKDADGKTRGRIRKGYAIPTAVKAPESNKESDGKEDGKANENPPQNDQDEAAE